MDDAGCILHTSGILSTHRCMTILQPYQTKRKASAIAAKLYNHCTTTVSQGLQVGWFFLGGFEGLSSRVLKHNRFTSDISKHFQTWTQCAWYGFDLVLATLIGNYQASPRISVFCESTSDSELSPTGAEWHSDASARLREEPSRFHFLTQHSSIRPDSLQFVSCKLPFSFPPWQQGRFSESYNFEKCKQVSTSSFTFVSVSPSCAALCAMALAGMNDNDRCDLKGLDADWGSSCYFSQFAVEMIWEPTNLQTQQ